MLMGYLKPMLFMAIAMSFTVSSTALHANNVLLIAVDDLRPPNDAHQHMPNLDRLRSKGTTFSRAYTQIALCSPSRTSLLTGLRPDTNRVWTIGPYFRTTMGSRGKDVVTLPQLFKEACEGLQTHALFVIQM